MLEQYLRELAHHEFVLNSEEFTIFAKESYDMEKSLQDLGT
jgi:hypothetical protein